MGRADFIVRRQAAGYHRAQFRRLLGSRGEPRSKLRRMFKFKREFSGSLSRQNRSIHFQVAAKSCWGTRVVSAEITGSSQSVQVRERLARVGLQMERPIQYSLVIAWQPGGMTLEGMEPKSKSYRITNPLGAAGGVVSLDVGEPPQPMRVFPAANWS